MNLIEVSDLHVRYGADATRADLFRETCVGHILKLLKK